jgi:hypothetical protein
VYPLMFLEASPSVVFFLPVWSITNSARVVSRRIGDWSFFFSLLTSYHEFHLCIVGFPWDSKLMLNGGMAFVAGRYFFPSS